MGTFDKDGGFDVFHLKEVEVEKHTYFHFYIFYHLLSNK